MSHQPRLHRRQFVQASAAIALAATTPVRAVTALRASTHDAAVSRALAQFPQYEANRNIGGDITLWGHGSFKHDFMGRLIGRWIREFKMSHSRVEFDYRMYGTASAIGALYSGAGNLAILGEEISPAASKAFRRAKGYSPTGFAVATGSVDANYFDYAHMIFVHESNPIARISLPQLADIFGAEPQNLRSLVREWGQLGVRGELASRVIQPYGWETDEDFGLFFRERVLQDSHRWNPIIKEFAHSKYADGSQYDHGQQILDALAQDPAGIAISNIRYKNAAVRPLPLAWTEDGMFVQANAETLIWQRFPLTRIIPAYVDFPPGEAGTPVLQEFLLFILSREGQTALVEESGYLPISPFVANEERARLA